MIVSLDNKKIKLLNKLKQKKYRELEQKFFVEGEHLVQMALEQQQVECVFITEDYQVFGEKLYKGNRVIAEIVTCYEYISDEIAAKIKETKESQGVFALCSMQKSDFDKQSIVIFDGVRDPGNVGTIIRTAQAFGVKNFYFTQDSVDVYNDKVVRASQGAIFLSKFFFEKSDIAILDSVEKQHQIFLLDLEGTDIKQVYAEKQNSYAIIVGNEGEGVHEKRWEKFSLTKVTIPINQNIESLNVGIATGIMLYHLSQSNN